MAEIVYALCGLTSIVCALLLTRGYTASKTRFLLWAALCFVGLAIDNVVLFVDLVLLPNVDLFVWRMITALLAMIVLLFGLIWETR